MRFHFPAKTSAKIASLIGDPRMLQFATFERSDNRVERLLPTGAHLIYYIDNTSTICGYSADGRDVVDVIMMVIDRLDSGDAWIIRQCITDDLLYMRPWRQLLFALDEVIDPSVLFDCFGSVACTIIYED